MSTKRLSLNNFFLRVARRYCPRDMTCKLCFMTRLGSFAQTLWARTFIGWKKLGHILARILPECTLHAFANCICICTHLQIVSAFCLSISFAPITHFCSNLLTRSSSIAYWLTLSRTVDLVHCTPSSARIRGSGKNSQCPNVRFASWLYLYRALDCNYFDKMHEVTKYVEFNIVLRKNV